MRSRRCMEELEASRTHGMLSPFMSQVPEVGCGWHGPSKEGETQGSWEISSAGGRPRDQGAGACTGRREEECPAHVCGCVCMYVHACSPCLGLKPPSLKQRHGVPAWPGGVSALQPGPEDRHSSSPPALLQTAGSRLSPCTDHSALCCKVDVF